MAALQSKGYHYQEHCQIIYIKNLPNFLFKTNQSGPVTMSDVLPWDLIKFQVGKLVPVVLIITKFWYLTGASAALLLGAWQISGWLGNSKHKSHSLDTSRKLMIRCVIRYWKRALDITSRHQSEGMLLDLVFCTLYSKGSIMWVQSSCYRMQCNSLMRRPQLSPKWFWCLRNYSSMQCWSFCFSFCLCVIRQRIITDGKSWQWSWWSQSFELKRRPNYHYAISSNDLMNVGI